MNNTIDYLYESLKSLYPIPADKREENVQVFALGRKPFYCSLFRPTR